MRSSSLNIEYSQVDIVIFTFYYTIIQDDISIETWFYGIEGVLMMI